MNWEHLKGRWQERGADSLEKIQDLVSETAALDRLFSARDKREKWIAVGMIPLFLGMAVFSSAAMAKLGCVLVAAGMVLIVIRLHRLQMKRPVPSADVCRHLRQQIHWLTAQVQLLGSVLWWYLLLPGLGVGLYFWSAIANTLFKGIALAGLLVVYGLIYRLNQVAVRHKLIPLRAQIEETLGTISADLRGK